MFTSCAISCRLTFNAEPISNLIKHSVPARKRRSGQLTLYLVIPTVSSSLTGHLLLVCEQLNETYISLRTILHNITASSPLARKRSSVIKIELDR